MEPPRKSPSNLRKLSTLPTLFIPQSYTTINAEVATNRQRSVSRGEHSPNLTSGGNYLEAFEAILLHRARYVGRSEVALWTDRNVLDRPCGEIRRRPEISRRETASI